MKNRAPHLLLPLAVLTALALWLPAAAGASPDAVVRDCAKDGSVDGNHSEADKRAALGQIPADLDEYSDCRAAISAAIGGGPKANASSNGSAGAAAAGSPQARRVAARRAARVREARRAQTRQALEKKLGPRSVDPRDPGVFSAANTANGIPPPLVAALVALALLSLAAALVGLWRRNPALAGVLRGVAPQRFRR